MLSPRRILLAAVAAQAAISFAEQGLPTITVFVEEDLELSASAAGAIVSMSGLGRLVGFYLAGRAVDRRGERRVLVVGGLGTGACLVLAALLPFAGVLALCFVAGVFLAAPAPAGSKLVHTAFPAARRGLAMGIRQAAVPAGGVAAAALVPALAASSSWRVALAASGVVAACGAVLVLVLTGLGPRVEDEPPCARQTIAGLLTREFVLLTAWAVALVAAQYVTMTFLAIDARDRAGVSAAAAATLLLVVQATGMASRIGWGAVADRLPAAQARWLPVGITLVGAAVALCLAVLPLHHLALFALLGFLAGASLNGWQGLWISRLTELAGTARAGTAAGVGLTFLAVSITVATPVFGAVADAAGTMRAMWGVLAALIGLAALAVAWSTRVEEARA
jgi:MFS family permease